MLETFVLPRSPLAAAAAEGRELDLEALARTVEARAAECDLLLVEGVGGLLVPLTPRRTVRDLLRRLDVEVVIAALPGLGTINHTALTVEAAREPGCACSGWCWSTPRATRTRSWWRRTPPGSPRSAAPRCWASCPTSAT